MPLYLHCIWYYHITQNHSPVSATSPSTGSVVQSPFVATIHTLRLSPQTRSVSVQLVFVDEQL